MRVCVTGATGFIGSRLVPELLGAGHEVTVVTRDPSGYDPPSEDVRVVEGDLLEPGSFDAALEDVDAAYYLVHSMGGEGDFQERDRRAARNFRQSADQAGVGRVIYLGGLGGEEEEEALSDHLQSRREVERLLDEGEYDLTVLRAAIVIGAGSASFEIVIQLGSRLPVMITPRWVRTPAQPIAVSDVVAYLVGVLDVPETAGDTFEVGGPDVLTYQEMLENTAELMGRRLYVVPVPVLTPTISAYWLDLVTDADPAVAHALVEGLRNPVVVTDDRIQDLIDVELTSFETAVERALAEKGIRVKSDRGR